MPTPAPAPKPDPHECYWCANHLPHPPHVHVRLKGPTHEK